MQRMMYEDLFESYVQAARDEEERQARSLAETKAEFQASLRDLAEAFILKMGRGELLAALGLAMDELEFPEMVGAATPLLRYTLCYEASEYVMLGGWLEFWRRNDDGLKEVKIVFPGMRVLYLPATDEKWGQFLRELMAVTHDRYARLVSEAEARIVDAEDVEALEAAKAGALRRFPECEETIVSLYTQARATLFCKAQALADAQRRAIEEAEEQEKAQAEAFYPFRVYRVIFGVVARDGEDEYVGTDRAWAFRSEPNENGWWDLFRPYGARAAYRGLFDHVAMIEQVDVMEPSDTYCVERDGVYFPPEGAERIEV